MSFLPIDDEFRNLSQTKELYKQIFDHSIIPIIIHDMYMNIVEVNDKVLEAFGYSRDEILELNILDLHTHNELEHSLEVLEKMQDSDRMIIKTEFKRKDGSIFTAEVAPCKIKLKNTAFIHVHINNMKDMKEAETEELSNKKWYWRS